MQAAVHDPVATLRPRIQSVLDKMLDRQRELLGAESPDLLLLVDAAGDLVAGGKRLRPAFCYWGWRGAGAPDDPAIVAASACLELFHAAALIHDDLMDGSDIRRGKPSVHRRFAEHHEAHRWKGDPAQFGGAAALLLGDLCLGWGDDLREGKRTILIAFAVEQASAAQAETLERLLGDHALDRAGVDALRALIDDTGALDRVERLISELVERSTAALADAEVGPEARDALSALITAATSRSV